MTNININLGDINEAINRENYKSYLHTFEWVVGSDDYKHPLSYDKWKEQRFSPTLYQPMHLIELTNYALSFG